MRVIAGKFRGKRLQSPDGTRVRPTSDRVKETMFNILFSKGYGADVRVLDLFGGTGNLGIEALSRGAELCVFTDIDRESCRFIRENLRVVGATAEVYHADWMTAVAKLSGRQFDVILIDPPYKNGREQEIVSLIMQYGILSADGIIVIEHAQENPIADIGGFVRDTRACGNTMLTFLTVLNHSTLDSGNMQGEKN